MLERVHRRTPAGADGAADEGDRLERWCEPALYLVQLLAFLAALVTIEGYEDTGGPSLVRILAVGCIALLPHLIGGTREPGTSPRRRAIVLLLALGLQLLLLAVLAQRSPVGLATGLTLAMVAWLGVRTREDALALMGVVFALALAAVALVAVPGTASLVLICVQLFACVLALLLVHGRAARRLGARAPGGTRLLEDSRRSMLMRLRYAALLSLALLLGTIFMQGLLQSAHRNAPESIEEQAEAEEQLARAEPPPAPSEAEQAGEVGSFPTSLDFSSMLGEPGGGLVLEATPFEGTSPWRPNMPLYLKGLSLDAFTRDGIQLSNGNAAGQRADLDDGVEDGWVQLVDTPPNEARYEFEIKQVPLPFGTLGEAPLFHLEPPIAVRAESVRYLEGELLATAEPALGLLEYRVRCALRAPQPAQLAGRSARHADDRWTAVPREERELAGFAELSRQWTRDATDDAGRVYAVMRELADFEYSYDISGFPGLLGLASFLELRRGYCVHFASTAALLLRLSGVSTRVAAGYLASEWDEERGLYSVRDRDGHAWLEVWFEGLGWVTFDPTPGNAMQDERDRLDPSVEPEAEDLASWSEDFQQALSDWASGSGSLMAVLDSLRTLPRVLLTSSSWWLPLALLSIVLTSIVLRRSFGGRGARQRGPARPDAPRADWYARLARLLAKHGYQRPAGETPREFAHRIVATGGAALAPMDGLTDLLYRDVYGAQPLDAEEHAHVERELAGLDARLREARST